jgi:hypothetical protein
MAPDEAHPTAVVTTWPDRTSVPYALFPLLVLVSRLLGPPPADGVGALGAAAPAAGLVIDHRSREVRAGGGGVEPAFQEFELLGFLASNPRKVFSRVELLWRVWGWGPENGARTVDVHIHRLRRKLGPRHGACLVTVRRVRYKFAPGASVGRHAPLPLPARTAGR